MKKINFKKFFNYFNFNNDEGLEIKVFRDWKVIIFSFVFLSLMIIIIDIYIFLRYQKEIDKEPNIEEVKILTIDRKSLQEAIDKVNIKIGQFQKVMDLPDIKDPSI